MADAARARKLAVRIREIVASTLETQVKDPRLGMITITDSKVTPDLREATVFYTVYGDETAVSDTIAALESARGVLRSAVGRQTGIKFTPTLDFVHDRIPDVARELDEALARAQAADAELAKVRDGATYAGDPDPYRVPREDDSDDDSDGDADDDSGRGASGDPVAFDPETETWTRRVGGEVDSARP